MKQISKEQQRLRQKRSSVFDDFYAFHKAHPDMRFWQALYAWSGFKYIMVSKTDKLEPTLEDYFDPYHMEGKNEF